MGVRCALVVSAWTVARVVEWAIANMESKCAGHAVTTHNNQGCESRLWAGPRRPNNCRLSLEVAQQLSALSGNGSTTDASVEHEFDN